MKNKDAEWKIITNTCLASPCVTIYYIRKYAFLWRKWKRVKGLCRHSTKICAWPRESLYIITHWRRASLNPQRAHSTTPSNDWDDRRWARLGSHHHPHVVEGARGLCSFGTHFSSILQSQTCTTIRRLHSQILTREEWRYTSSQGRARPSFIRHSPTLETMERGTRRRRDQPPAYSCSERPPQSKGWAVSTPPNVPVPREHCLSGEKPNRKQNTWKESPLQDVSEQAKLTHGERTENSWLCAGAGWGEQRPNRAGAWGNFLGWRNVLCIDRVCSAQVYALYRIPQTSTM